MEQKLYIFGYGSIINPQSAEKTLRRNLNKNEIVECNLGKYERVWNVVDSVIISDSKHTLTDAVFLNIQKNKDKLTNGVIIEISKVELERFDERERNYDRIDVTENIIPKINDGIVYTYIGKKMHLSNNSKNIVLLTKYHEIVQKGLQCYDSTFQDNFANNTKSHNFKFVEGDYIFTDNKQRKMKT